MGETLSWFPYLATHLSPSPCFVTSKQIKVLFSFCKQLTEYLPLFFTSYCWTFLKSQRFDIMNHSRIVHKGFLEKLSFEIISNIFRYLNQVDCFNCMATCREWYERIPQFTQDNWKALQLDEKGISQHQVRNLGKHVKHVSFNDVGKYLISGMMQKLLDCEWDGIESLGKILYLRNKFGKE